MADIEKHANEFWSNPALHRGLIGLSAGCCLLFWFYPQPPGVAVAVLGTLAAFMSFLDMKKTHKLLGMIAISLLTYIELRDIRVDRAKSDSDRALADKEVAVQRQQEQKAFSEIASGISKSIEQSQAQFAVTMAQGRDTINGLARNINTVTGGDSFSWAEFIEITPSNVRIAVHQSGEYPIHGLSVRVLDLDKLGEARKGSGLSIFNALALQTVIDVPYLVRDFTRVIGPFPATDDTFRNLEISFNAINGGWVQILQRRKVGAKWHNALKVIRFKNARKDNMEHRVLMERVDADYPRVNGKVDWLVFE